MSQRVNNVNDTSALLLAECAFKAYKTDAPPIAPDGYRFIQYWWGRNPFYFRIGDDEKFGVIFQNTLRESEYIFAFKGTVTDYDWLEDARFLFKSDFNYYNGNSLDPEGSVNYSGDVKVAYGFNAIYTTQTKNGHGSMQQQLFDFIQNNNVTSLGITGHSLGSALAELFTLDLNHYLLQNPERSLPYLHYNFACPRVGNASFANTYNVLEQSKMPTLRLVNYKDEVPCLPTNLFDYYHGPDYFMFAFEWDVSEGHKLRHPIEVVETRHSMYNYWQVLKEVIFAPNPHYPAFITGYKDHRLKCTIPDSSITECQIL